MDSDSSFINQFSSTEFNFSMHCPEQRDFAKTLNIKIKVEKSVEFTATKIVSKSMSDDTQKIDNSTGCKKLRNKIPKSKIPNINSRRQTKKKKVPINYSNNSAFKDIFNNFKKVAFLSALVLTFAIILKNCYIFDDLGTDKYDNTTDDLEKLLYGQDEVIAKIKSNLNFIDSQQIYIFTGGTGVGKTYTSNIISSNFPWKYNIQKIVSQFNNEDIIKNLARYDFNLLIIDSLKATDDIFMIEFVKTLLLLPRKIILFLIFNIQEVSLDLKKNFDLISASNNISNAFNTAKIDHVLFVFNKLTKQDIIKCIEFELEKTSGIKNEYNIQRILQTVDYEYSGCKGVYSKVALIK